MLGELAAGIPRALRSHADPAALHTHAAARRVAEALVVAFLGADGASPGRARPRGPKLSNARGIGSAMAPSPTPPPLHADGTSCPEGTRRVPVRFTACCAEFDDRTRACYHDIRFEWWSRPRAWFIIIAPDAGGGGIRFRYCPCCGTALNSKPQR